MQPLSITLHPSCSHCPFPFFPCSPSVNDALRRPVSLPAAALTRLLFYHTESDVAAFHGHLDTFHKSCRGRGELQRKQSSSCDRPGKTLFSLKRDKEEIPCLKVLETGTAVRDSNMFFCHLSKITDVV